MAVWTTWLRLAALLALTVLCLGGRSYAAKVDISPMLIEVPPSSMVATYELHNKGSEQLGLQIEAFRWKQTLNEKQLTPADELLIVPAIISIPPGQRQLVRVALRAQRPASGLNYRVHFKQLPAQSSEGRTTIQTLLTTDVPLFFAAEREVNEYEARLLLGNRASEVILEVANTGTRFLRVRRLQLKNEKGQTVSDKSGPLYVLPGVTQRWVMNINNSAELDHSEKGQSYYLHVDSSQGEHSHLLGFN